MSAEERRKRNLKILAGVVVVAIAAAVISYFVYFRNRCTKNLECKDKKKCYKNKCTYERMQITTNDNACEGKGKGARFVVIGGKRRLLADPNAHVAYEAKFPLLSKELTIMTCAELEKIPVGTIITTSDVPSLPAA